MAPLPGMPTDGSQPTLTPPDDGVEVRFLTPEEYPLINHFFDSQNVPRLDPNWSKVVAAVDKASGQVVGIMCLQLVAHAEPIIIDPAYRGRGLWREMADMMDGYAGTVGLPGLYTQPTSEVSAILASRMGFTEMAYPLYLKIYSPHYRSLTPTGTED